jgi:small subunit ribosomal protein S20
MPNIKSAKKRLKQNIVRRLRNRSAKRAIRTECKKVIDAAKAGNVDLAAAELRTAAKKLDQAAAKHVIHRNAAARVKSRLSAKVKAAKGQYPSRSA